MLVARGRPRRPRQRALRHAPPTARRAASSPASRAKKSACTCGSSCSPTSAWSGFPNAGKSTLIARISAARPKIADYPFTTLTPNLGVVRLSERSELRRGRRPGLIEGAHAGHGLGDQFLGHLERTKVLVHVVDVSSRPGRDPVEDFEVIRRELALFRDERGADIGGAALADKPQLAAANKIDALDDPERLPRLREHLRRRRASRSTPISAVTGEGVPALLEAIWRELATARRDRSTHRIAGCIRMNRAVRTGYPGWHVRSDPSRTPRRGACRPRSALDSIACCCCPSQLPPHRPCNRAPRPFHRFAHGRAGRARIGTASSHRPRAAERGAVIHGGHARPAVTSGYPCHRSFSSSPAPTRLQKSRPGRDYPAFLDRCAFRRGLAARLPRQRPSWPAASAGAAACGCCSRASKLRTDPRRRFFCSTRPTADVSSTEIRRG